MNLFRICLLSFNAFAACLPAFALAETEHDEKIRIGVYDSRAIAIAYAPSKFNPVKEKMKQMQQAKADGDKKKIAQLEDWGRKHQRQLHRQGFSDVPVGDLLAHVKDGMAEIASKADVVAIVRKCDFVAEDVEVVDVTNELVQLFDPNEKTLRYVKDIKDKPAIDLDDVEKHNKEDGF